MSVFEDTVTSNIEEDNNMENPFGMEEDGDPYGIEEDNDPYGMGEENEENNDKDEEDNVDIDLDFDVYGNTENDNDSTTEIQFHDASEAKDHENQHTSHLNTDDIFYIPETKDSVCLKLPDETFVTYNHTLKILEFKTDIGTFLNSSFIPPDPREKTSIPSPRDRTKSLRKSTLDVETIFGDSTFNAHSRKKHASQIFVEENSIVDGAGLVGEEDDNFLQSGSSTSNQNDNESSEKEKINVENDRRDSMEYVPKKSLLERLMDHEKHGHMVKLGAIKNKFYGDSWKKRYFELKQGKMTYREEKNSPVIKTVHLHSLCTIERKQATDNARKDRYDMKEFHDKTKTRLAESLTSDDYENLDSILNQSNVQYLGKVGRDHTLELHVPLTQNEFNSPNAFHRTYYMQCENSTEEASWYEKINATIQTYRDYEKEELLNKMNLKRKEEEQERRKQVDEELKQMQENVSTLSIEEQEKERKKREEELEREARRASKKPVDVNALIRQSNHPDMSVVYYQKLLYTDMAEDDLLPYIYLFYDKVKEVCGLEEF